MDKCDKPPTRNPAPASTQYSVLSTQHPSRCQTPLHHWHVVHGARFAEIDGWQIPAVYTVVEHEIAAARYGVGLADISAFAKTNLVGPRVTELARALAGAGRVTRPGGVTLLDICGPGLACRLGAEQLLLLASTTNAKQLGDPLAALLQAHAVVHHDVTSAYAGFCLIGPHTEGVLRQLTSVDVSSAALPAGSCAETSLAGAHALLVRAPDMRLPSIRVYVAWDLAEYAWESLLSAGGGVELTPLGLEAWRRLMIAEGN